MRKKSIMTALLLLAGLAAAVYAADDLWARYRGKPLVEVSYYQGYSPRNNWRRSEYAIASPEEAVSQTCVRAMLPHFGFPPCWYLLKHALSQPENP
jgi:hypothetical protein